MGFLVFLGVNRIWFLEWANLCVKYARR